ncbi:MAG: hypothetical protein QOH46_1521, partial [Solirubrobacteraceae bacterium]|nr:hypothetical protein [Solirubrobacteraceae bacterium]
MALQSGISARLENARRAVDGGSRAAPTRRRHRHGCSADPANVAPSNTDAARRLLHRWLHKAWRVGGRSPMSARPAPRARPTHATLTATACSASRCGAPAPRGARPAHGHPTTAERQRAIPHRHTGCVTPRGVQNVSFSATKYPHIRDHFVDAVRHGWNGTLVVDRVGAERAVSVCCRVSRPAAVTTATSTHRPSAAGSGSGASATGPAHERGPEDHVRPQSHHQPSRSFIADELRRVGLDVLSDPAQEPLVVRKRARRRVAAHRAERGFRAAQAGAPTGDADRRARRCRSPARPRR